MLLDPPAIAFLRDQGEDGTGRRDWPWRIDAAVREYLGDEADAAGRPRIY